MRPSPEPRVAKFLDRVAAEGIGLTAITVWEFLNGIGRLDSGRRRAEIAERFEGMLDDFFEDRVSIGPGPTTGVRSRHGSQRRRAVDDHLPDAVLARLRPPAGFITRNVDDFRNTDGTVNPWTRADARVCAHVMEAKRRQGEPLDDHLPDAVLASTAASRRLAVITRNVDDFRNTDVRTVNPWTGVGTRSERRGS